MGSPSQRLLHGQSSGLRGVRLDKARQGRDPPGCWLLRPGVGCRLPALQPPLPPSEHAPLPALTEEGGPPLLQGQLPQRPLEGRCLHCWFPQPPEKAGEPSSPSSHLHSPPPLTPLRVTISHVGEAGSQLPKRLHVLCSMDPNATPETRELEALPHLIHHAQRGWATSEQKQKRLLA